MKYKICPVKLYVLFKKLKFFVIIKHKEYILLT